MADISYGYTPSGRELTTQGPAPQGFGGLGLPSMGRGPDFEGLLRYRMQADQERRAQEAQLRTLQMSQMRQGLQGGELALQQARRGPISAPMRSQPGDEEAGRQAALQKRLGEAQLRQARSQAELAEAATRPMPTSLKTIGMSTGYLGDTMKLPIGLLPSQAHFERGGLSPTEQGIPGQSRLLEEQARAASTQNAVIQQLLSQLGPQAVAAILGGRY